MIVVYFYIPQKTEATRKCHFPTNIHIQHPHPPSSVATSKANQSDWTKTFVATVQHRVWGPKTLEWVKLRLGWNSGWRFQRFFIFTPSLVKWSNLTNIFQVGWNHQLELEPGGPSRPLNKSDQISLRLHTSFGPQKVAFWFRGNATPYVTKSLGWWNIINAR